MIRTGLAIPALAGLLAGAFFLIWQGAPWAFVAGTALATGAPLVFILGRRRSRERLNEHPLIVSIVSGLGCVTVMVASQRFGSDHDWSLFVAVTALVIWLLWQRGQRRTSLPPES